MEYNYKEANFENKTTEEIEKNSIYELLFESSGPTDRPAIHYEVNIINSVIDDEIDNLEVKEVKVIQVRDDKVVFEVRTSNVNVTVPDGSTDHSIRVCHTSDIPYKYYDIALLD